MVLLRNILTRLRPSGSEATAFVRLQAIGELVEYLRPQCQRVVSVEHVDDLVRDIEEDLHVRGELAVLQSITVAQLPDNTHFILDGSHRLMAFARLLPQVAQVRLPVVVYRCRDADEVRFWYQRINHHLPIHPLELELAWSDKVKPLCEFVQREYREYLSRSDAPRCPNVSLARIQSALQERAEALQHEAVTPEGLVQDLQELHDVVLRDLRPRQLVPSERLERCVQKRPDHPCVLGFWRREEWIDLLLYRRIHQLRWEEVPWARFTESAERKRAPIPIAVRRQVWAKTNAQGASSSGVCYVCEEPLHFEHMECAHDVPHCLGGTDTVANLWPTCRGCNRDMGIRTLQSYRALVQAMRRETRMPIKAAMTQVPHATSSAA